MALRSEHAHAHPLSVIESRPTVLTVLAEGPVRCLLASGGRDDGSWGIAGAFWLSIDGERGGFAVSPEALWTGSELARSYRGALDRGWTAEHIYAYWQTQVGMAGGRLMIDPQQHVDSLFAVHRRVGAL